MLKITFFLFPFFGFFLGLGLFAQTVADFSLKNVDGNTDSLSSYKDKKAVVVIFTSNHCVYSKKYEDRILAINSEFSGKGVQVILINSNDPVQSEEDNYTNMQLRAKEKGFSFPYLQDISQSVAKSFGAQRTPEAFILKSSGGTFTVAYKGAIDNNPLMPEKVTSSLLKDALNAVLANTTVAQGTSEASGCNIKWK